MPTAQVDGAPGGSLQREAKPLVAAARVAAAKDRRLQPYETH